MLFRHNKKETKEKEGRLKDIEKERKRKKETDKD